MMKEEAYISELESRGIVPGMDSIRRLLREVGDPQNNLPVVHIAGTNGKGSTFAFLDSILRCSGCKVGRYLSPAINGYREKFQINGSYIEEDELSDLFARIKEADRRIQERGCPGPTLFEVETALSFMYFYRNKVDYVLLETGMGGRDDATNVIKKPLLSVISSISFDHMAWLGDSLSEIAVHKAGIIKPGCPVVASRSAPEVMQVLRERAREMEAPFTEVAPAHILEETPEGTSFTFKDRTFHCPLPGAHQVENACLALEAGMILLQNEQEEDLFPILQEGIRRTRWPGRLELLAKDPLFYRDGAHNIDGVSKLKAFVEKHFTNRRIIYIIGVLKDKEYDEMVRLLVPSASVFYVFRPKNKRGLDEEILAESIRKRGGAAVVFPGVNEAVKKARETCHKEDVMILCGSLSFMEEMNENVWKQ